MDWILPGAAESTGLVPHFLHKRVVLDDDGVLDKSSGRRRRSISAALVGRRSHAARVEVDVESGAQLAGSRPDVNAVGIAVVSLAEDHSVKGPVELDVDPHVRLFALDLKVLDLRLIAGLADGPSVLRSGTRNGCGWIVLRWRRKKRSRCAGLDVVWQRDLPLVGGRWRLTERDGSSAVLHRKRSRIGRFVSIDALQKKKKIPRRRNN